MSVPASTWIQTFQAGIYDYADPGASTPITLSTIAHSLARTYRFRGHSRYRWTVAEHSILVHSIGLQLLATEHDKLFAAPYLLLHDAHEAFLGDIPAPLKKYLKTRLGFDFATLEMSTDRRIYKDLGIPFPPAWITSCINEADTYALKVEREAFMSSRHEWVIDEIPMPAELKTNLTKEVGIASITRIFRLAMEKAIHEFLATE